LSKLKEIKPQSNGRRSCQDNKECALNLNRELILEAIPPKRNFRKKWSSQLQS
jgi:hypothetical protein